MLERQRQRAMAAHTVTGDALPGQIGREMRGNHARQFIDQPSPHLKMRRPRRLRGINIETRRLPHIPRRIIGHIRTAR